MAGERARGGAQPEAFAVLLDLGLGERVQVGDDVGPGGAGDDCGRSSSDTKNSYAKTPPFPGRSVSHENEGILERNIQHRQLHVQFRLSRHLARSWQTSLGEQARISEGKLS